jgi:predicted alpha-1,2-mannosidase
MKHLILTLCPLIAISAGLAVEEPAKLADTPPDRPREPVDWVDCLIGTSSSRWMLYPGPSMPFGMVKLSPDNQGDDPAVRHWKAGYEYTIGNIMGFSHVHSWTMGGLLTMPATGPLRTQPGPEDDPDAGYRSRFRHETETATPGYYAVTLDDYGIRAELTCTTRAGFQRYTFPESREARILFDLWIPTEYGTKVHDAGVTRISDTEIAGFVEMSSGLHYQAVHYQDYKLHFVARTNRPFDSMDSWHGDEVSRDVKVLAGRGDTGVCLNFKTAQGERILLQTGISLVSIDQARLNLDTEMKRFGWDFDACHQAARTTWNDLLGRVTVEGGREVDHRKFYTNLYRAYCARTIWSDVNGKYTDMYEQVQQLPDPDSPVYGSDAFWNTFWNLNPLWNLVTPDVSEKWVRSLLEIYDKGGWLPKGPTGIEYSSIMEASHAIPLIVAAYQHGIRGYDVEKAFEAMVHSQTTPARNHPAGGHVGNRDLIPYLEHGYVPIGKGSASNTLEYAYDDWCVAQMARALGREREYEQFSKRAENWRNLFDKETGFMRARHPDGRWQEDFDPYGKDGGWTEGNPWQYTWFVPQNVPGLIGLMGRQRFVERLNEGLGKSSVHHFNAPDDRMATVPINHGNQPSMQVAYLFNHAGSPWLTQKWVRAIMDRYYGDTPHDGWPGDEDQGQGGAWFAMSALGLFQTDGGCRVEPIYEIGSPLFDRAVIRLDPDYHPGGRFVIEARNNGPRNVFIQSATLNGKPLDKPWFSAREALGGGHLVLHMGPEPNMAWGADTGDAP